MTSDDSALLGQVDQAGQATVADGAMAGSVPVLTSAAGRVVGRHRQHVFPGGWARDEGPVRRGGAGPGRCAAELTGLSSPGSFVGCGGDGRETGCSLS